MPKFGKMSPFLGISNKLLNFFFNNNKKSKNVNNLHSCC